MITDKVANANRAHAAKRPGTECDMSLEREIRVNKDPGQPPKLPLENR